MKPALRLALITLCLAAGAAGGSTAPPAPDDLPDPGITRLSGSSVELPLDLSSGRPILEVEIDGEGPYRFVVDSGAGLSVLDARIAADLELEVVGSQLLRSPGTTSPITGDRVLAARLEAGGLTIERPVLATMDLAGFSAGTIDGVLGRPHFHGYLLTLDYPGSRMRVARGTLGRTDPNTLEFDRTAGSIRLPLDVSGTTVPMVLDTGSPGAFVLPRALEPLLTWRSAPEVGPTIRLVGGFHESWRATLDGTVRLAAIDYVDPEVVLTTMSDEFGNIGFGVLRDLAVTLDLAGGLVRFERRTSDTGQAPSTAGPIRRGGPIRVGGPGEPPRLGVAFEMTPTGFVRDRGGLIVRWIDAGSPAELAGLRVGDILVTAGGEPLEAAEGMMEIAQILRAPRPLEMEILRGDERLTLVVR